jgi:hypothetical protein
LEAAYAYCESTLKFNMIKLVYNQPVFINFYSRPLYMIKVGETVTMEVNWNCIIKKLGRKILH